MAAAVDTAAKLELLAVVVVSVVLWMELSSSSGKMEEESNDSNAV